LEWRQSLASREHSKNKGVCSLFLIQGSVELNDERTS